MSELQDFVFFSKQKTAYERRISDWSSEVVFFRSAHPNAHPARHRGHRWSQGRYQALRKPRRDRPVDHPVRDRKSVVSGKSVEVRVDLGCSRIINKNTTITIQVT